MTIHPVDSQNNLYSIRNLMPQHIVDQLLATDWMNLNYQRERYQETWNRRRVDVADLPWFSHWEDRMHSLWDLEIVQRFQPQFKKTILPYPGTAFWVDEPGFTCDLHTDGELPGSIQIMWHGESNLGTTFYNSKNFESVRYQVDFVPNNGYIMINQPDSNGAQPLLWHAMMNPVLENSFRVTSYTMINAY